MDWLLQDFQADQQQEVQPSRLQQKCLGMRHSNINWGAHEHVKAGHALEA